MPKHYTIGYLQQHLKFSRPTLLEEACLGLPAGQQGESWRVEKILLGLGFSKEDFTRPPEAFSGGFQVRLNLGQNSGGRTQPASSGRTLQLPGYLHPVAGPFLANVEE